jgi:hypothetical protein
MPPKKGKRKQCADDDSGSFSAPQPRKSQLNLPLAKTLTLDSAQNGIELLASAERDKVSLATLLVALRMLVPIVEAADREERLKHCAFCRGAPHVTCSCGNTAYCSKHAESFRCSCESHDCERHWCAECVIKCDFCKRHEHLEKSSKPKPTKKRNAFVSDCMGLEKRCGKQICIHCDEEMGLAEGECNCDQCLDEIY